MARTAMAPLQDVQEASMLMEEIEELPETEVVMETSETSSKKLPKFLGFGLLIAVIGTALAYLIVYKPLAAKEVSHLPSKAPLVVLDANDLPTADKLRKVVSLVQHYQPNASALDGQLLKGHLKTEAENTFRMLPDDSIKVDLSPRRNLEISACAWDVFQIVVTTAQIVNSIKGLTEACEQPYPVNKDRRTTCASLVMLQISFYGFIITYVADAVSSCPGVFNLHAGCAMGINGFLTTVVKIGATAAQMSGNCNQGIPPSVPPVAPAEVEKFRSKVDPLVWDQIQMAFDQWKQKQELRKEDQFAWAIGGGRRLQENNATHVRRIAKDVDDLHHVVEHIRQLASKLPTDPLVQPPMRGMKTNELKGMAGKIETNQNDKEKVNWAKSACVVDTLNFAAKMAAMGNSMGFSAMDCKKEYFEKRGHPGKDKCAIDIGLIFGNLGIAANMIALDIMNCPATLEYNADALCAGALVDVVARAGFLVVAFAGIQDSCGSLDSD